MLVKLGAWVVGDVGWGNWSKAIKKTCRPSVLSTLGRESGCLTSPSAVEDTPGTVDEAYLRRSNTLYFHHAEARCRRDSKACKLPRPTYLMLGNAPGCIVEARNLHVIWNPRSDSQGLGRCARS